MKLWLHPEGRPDDAVLIEEPAFTIGRAGDSDWVLASPGVSRRHLVIRRLNGMYLAEDVSRNGTRLNGGALARGEPVSLAAGDRLEIDGLSLLASDRAPEGHPSDAPLEAPLHPTAGPRDDPFDGLPEVPDLSGSDVERSWVPPPDPPRDPLSLARGLFDLLLDDLDPARFEREGRTLAGRKRRVAAWGRYHRHFRRIQVDPEAYFRRLIDEDTSSRTRR